MQRGESKSILELRKAYVKSQRNIENLYSLFSGLFNEVQDIKKFVNYKPENNLGDVESSNLNINHPSRQQHMPGRQNFPINPMQNSMNVLDNVEEFTDNIQRGKKLKIINN